MGGVGRVVTMVFIGATAARAFGFGLGLGHEEEAMEGIVTHVKMSMNVGFRRYSGYPDVMFTTEDVR